LGVKHNKLTRDILDKTPVGGRNYLRTDGPTDVDTCTVNSHDDVMNFTRVRACLLAAVNNFLRKHSMTTIVVEIEPRYGLYPAGRYRSNRRSVKVHACEL